MVLSRQGRYEFTRVPPVLCCLYRADSGRVTEFGQYLSPFLAGLCAQYLLSVAPDLSQSDIGQRFLIQSDPLYDDISRNGLRRKMLQAMYCRY